MNNLPTPITTTDFYLEAVLKELMKFNSNLVTMASELATLNQTLQAQPKPVIKIDATELANRLETLVKATNATANNQANEVLQTVKRTK